ncbi:ornithine carbamoyltransferase [Haloarchaeobius iranensis]|uniref:Ornithine carbamoyltransferase n=1 Tax=Haloarchaeobius iranensis TaxID=996166 RepID=A0A1G9VKL8_9EURY|nr:ornithine carbamoyltransferase [Haloarchaeobius iranensis]SDM72657.1 ornithine carbamoyltransferase [Haloarchaeobius iranensis]
MSTHTDVTSPNPAQPPKHFLTVDDLSAAELQSVLDLAAEYKRAVEDGEPHGELGDKTLAMLFEKPSTRTRVSFETGMTQLGGHAVFLGPEDTQLDRGEPVKDTARALSGYVDAIMARVFDHDDLAELAAYAEVPVVNGLTDDAHPCQTLADLLTIKELFGGFDDVTAAWVGDGNNVASSFAVGCAMVGIDLTVACPEGHGLADEVLEAAAEVGTPPTVTTDPATAVADADIVYTDVWVSMGEDDDKVDDFDGFTLSESLLDGTDAKVMHCLPAVRGQEITEETIESDRSVVWQQAENRMHAQKALLATLVG